MYDLFLFFVVHFIVMKIMSKVMCDYIKLHTKLMVKNAYSCYCEAVKVETKNDFPYFFTRRKMHHYLIKIYISDLALKVNVKRMTIMIMIMLYDVIKNPQLICQVVTCTYEHCIWYTYTNRG